MGADAVRPEEESKSLVSRLDTLRGERRALLAAIRAASAQTAGESGSGLESGSVRLAGLEADRTALDAAIVSARAASAVRSERNGPPRAPGPPGTRYAAGLGGDVSGDLGDRVQPEPGRDSRRRLLPRQPVGAGRPVCLALQTDSAITTRGRMVIPTEGLPAPASPYAKPRSPSREPSIPTSTSPR